MSSVETEQDGSDKRDNRGGPVSTSLAILRHLATVNGPVGVNAIARRLSLPPSSCFKALKILHAEEFVDFDPATKGYSLGVGAITLAQRALDPANAFSIIRDRLEVTAERLSVAIGLWRVLPTSRIVLIGYTGGVGQTRIHMSVGQRLPLLMGALGRAIAARLDLPRDELKRQFDALRWQVPLSFTDYTAQVEDAKRLGHGLDEGSFSRGVTTIAQVIADELGVARYGLSAVMFSGHFDKALRQPIADELAALADWASARLR